MLALTSKTLTEKSLKQLKFRVYKEEYGGTFGIPKSHAVALQLCRYLIKLGRLSSPGDIEAFLGTNPLIRGYIYPRDIEDLNRRITDSPPPDTFLTLAELKTLKDQDFLKRKSEEVFQHEKERAGVDIEREHERRRAELEKEFSKRLSEIEDQKKALERDRSTLDHLLSDVEDFRNLDDEALSKVDVKLATTVEMEQSRWWQNLGLFQNPFPTTQGLSLIDESYYDGLILKTPIFTSYFEMITRSPDQFLNRAHVVLGYFGSGKTTLFDYLKKPLLVHQVFPIHIMLDAERDVDVTRRRFFRLLHLQLSKRARELHAGDLWAPPTLPDEADAAIVMAEIRRLSTFSGFAIFIDGLHKRTELQGQALKFLELLQNTQEFWVREGEYVGMVVAGIPAWKRDLELSPTLRGSFYRQVEMPEISAGDAYAMLERRLKTFSMDPADPTRIRRAPVEKVYAILKEKLPRPVTYRDVVDEIVPRLKRRDYGFVEVALDFDELTLTALKGELTSRVDLNSNLDRLRLILKSRPGAFDAAIRLLVFIFSARGIHERDAAFKDNREFFGLFYNLGLIQKMATKDRRGFSWVVTRDLLEFGQQLAQKWNTGVPETLPRIMKESSSPPPLPKSHEPEEVSMAKDIASAQRSSREPISASLEIALERHVEILAHLRAPEDLIPADQVLQRTEEALRPALWVVANVAQGNVPTDADSISLRAVLTNTWFTLDELHDYWEHTDRLRGTQLTKPVATELCISYIRAFKAIVYATDQFLKLNAVLDLATPDLSREDRQELHKARDAFANRRYLESVRLASDHLERRVRDCCYAVLKLKYGEKWRSRLGETVNSYIDGLRTGRGRMLPADTANPNELYHCSRGHYRLFISASPSNWLEIFGPIFAPRSQETVDEALRMVFELGHKDKHNQTEDYFRRHQAEILRALQETGFLLSRLNKAIPLLLEPSNVFVISEPGSKSFFFSFLKNADQASLVAFRPDPKVATRLADRIIGAASGDQPETFDLANIPAVEVEYGVDFRTVFAVLGVLANSGRASLSLMSGSVLAVAGNRDAPKPPA